MGVFDKMKRAFGLDSDFDDPDIVDDVVEQPRATVTPRRQPPQSAGLRKPSLVNGDMAAPASETVTTDTIFEHVVRVFNEALPDFLQKSVDPVRQSKALYDSLTEDMKDYIEASRKATEAQCRRIFEAEKTKLQANIREMESRYSQYNSMRDELQQKLAGSDRQRRSLTERNKDLQDQVVQLEAEREQFQLEIKSLKNKLKVADVRGTDNQGAEKELTELRQELSNAKAELLKARAQAVAKVVDNNTDGEDNKAAVDAIVAAAVKSAQEETEQRVRAELKAETDRLVAEARAEVNPEKSLSELRQVKDSEIEVLRRQLDEMTRKAEGLKKTVALNTDMQARSERKYKEELEEVKSRLAERDAEIEKLRLQPAPAERGDAEKKSRTEQRQVPEKKEYTPRKSRNLRAPSLAAPAPLDDILGDTDWLVSPGAVAPKEDKSRESRKHKAPNDDSQLSLF